MQHHNILNEGYNYRKLASTAKGSRLNINNKPYLDLSNCAGSILIGHNNKVIKKSISEVLKKYIKLCFPKCICR